jgi:hypothetical protein
LEWFDFGFWIWGFDGLGLRCMGVDGFWVFVFIFLTGGVWIQIRGLGSRYGVVKVLKFFVFLFG